MRAQIVSGTVFHRRNRSGDVAGENPGENVYSSPHSRRRMKRWHRRCRVEGLVEAAVNRHDVLRRLYVPASWCTQTKGEEVVLGRFAAAGQGDLP